MPLSGGLQTWKAEMGGGAGRGLKGWGLGYCRGDNRVRLEDPGDRYPCTCLAGLTAARRLEPGFGATQLLWPSGLLQAMPVCTQVIKAKNGI